MRKNQKKIENLVEKILIEVPSTRNDDYELIAEYYSRECPEVLNMNFKYVFLGHKTLALPSFKSIERARRKVQAKFPELVSETTKLKRKKIEEEYRDYYSKMEDLYE